MTEDVEVLILVAHGTEAPAFAAHAFHLAGAAAALGATVGLYLAVEGATWLSGGAPQELARELDELRGLGVVVYACPRSLTDHGLVPKADAYVTLGAAAAVSLARRARTVVSL